MVEALLDNSAMRRHRRTHAVRAHLLEAARLTASLPEQRYLNRQVERLT